MGKEKQMLFNSVFFITIFLPITLVGWYLLQKIENPIYAKIFLTAMSFWFYGYYNISYIWILLASLLVNYILSFLFEKSEKKGVRKTLLVAGILANLGLLFYFKYFNFFIDNCNFIFHADFSIEKIALPLGISFFTFQQISFIVERYRKTAEHYSLVDYSCFVTFFPQLVAGPIVLHEEFLPQLRKRENRKISAEYFFDGSALFILGLSKKVLLADALAVLVNAEYVNVEYLDCPTAWITIVSYMLELYFDFSGYCDMARGIGMMFGFILPENFDAPLKAVSVKDFWRRWHMTLSRFLSQYIYFPLGGNRKGQARKCVNLMIVFLASGIWHGANWTFIVWGLMHGVFMVFESILPKLRLKWEEGNRVITFILVTLSFSIFRSDSLPQTLSLWQKLFAGGFHGRIWGVCNVLKFPENYVIREVLERVYPKGLNWMYLGMLILLWMISFFLIRGKKAGQWINEKAQTTWGLLLLATLFAWSFISLSQVSVFLYFNF